MNTKFRLYVTGGWFYENQEKPALLRKAISKEQFDTNFDLMKGSETDDVFRDVSSLIEKSRRVAYQSVNVFLLQRNWLIGKRIHDKELKNSKKENYGLEVIKTLSKRLGEKYVKGFSGMSLYNFLSFYKAHPNIFHTSSGKSYLFWSHYLILMQVDDEKARKWYEEETVLGCWSVRVLQRNVSIQCYYRLLKS